ncbi:hypothetical protein BBK36DRAFT_1203736 [Trichoderma citrinoviride]|uniref:Xylanolytic transcriptional activator regulatory domain-containing protein n=1 Tax=Trichoderma citrinoviride TaxID=58853 RepID=A0A2T4B6M5_9HYPO|nr:hypothetical protein BBK36DRAFT_1203736 [Trichoderma citrinoviride]PTB64975.1 hypothetical protein BBK36DRAFT_1203736 [Trichoderma citrinoviride]
MRSVSKFILFTRYPTAKSNQTGPCRGGIGERKKTPCVSCLQSNSECVLAESRRGGNFRNYEPNKKQSARNRKASQRTLDPPPVAAGLTERKSTYHIESLSDNAVDEQLVSELRNPSDALHILAQSEKPESIASSTLPQERDDVSRIPSGAAFLSEYELVEKGLIHHTTILDLLCIYSHNYHPYCPIVPQYMLGQSATEKISRSDFFLLTVILTIASRDSPSHSPIHRYCWDYAQRLLLEVLLGYPWTLRSRTVESLLLLSEWLPHIELTHATPNENKSIFIEDRTSWSLVGLAVRQAYLMRLDQGAFPNATMQQETKEQAEHKRLIWTFVYIADRQISVRLGQSFWSRGPSLSTRFTAKDFPSLQPSSRDSQDDYASVHQATMELIQLMHNVQGILYASPKRTLAIVHDGDYSRYLDDFQRAAMNWQAAWNGLAVSPRVKRSLSLVYEYLCLYVNAFSFQAVLTRISTSRSISAHSPSNKQPEKPFSKGIMRSADGRYVWDAITAATNTLKLMTEFNPQRELCFLPYRYYLRQETAALVHKFVSALDEAAPDRFHIGHRYSQLLRNLWPRGQRKSSKAKDARDTSTVPPPTATVQQLPTREIALAPLLFSESSCDQRNKPVGADPYNFQGSTLSPDVGDFSSMEDYPFGPFINTANFELADFGNPLNDMSLSSVKWETSFIGM